MIKDTSGVKQQFPSNFKLYFFSSTFNHVECLLRRVPVIIYVIAVKRLTSSNYTDINQ